MHCRDSNPGCHLCGAYHCRAHFTDRLLGKGSEVLSDLPETTQPGQGGVWI